MRALWLIKKALAGAICDLFYAACTRLQNFIRKQDL